MEEHALYYDTIIRLTEAISHCKDPEEVALITAESVKTAFKAKGCSVFLVDRATRYVEHLLAAGGRNGVGYEAIVRQLFTEMDRMAPGESVVLRTYRALSGNRRFHLRTPSA